MIKNKLPTFLIIILWIGSIYATFVYANSVAWDKGYQAGREAITESIKIANSLIFFKSEWVLVGSDEEKYIFGRPEGYTYDQ